MSTNAGKTLLDRCSAIGNMNTDWGQRNIEVCLVEWWRWKVLCGTSLQIPLLTSSIYNKISRLTLLLCYFSQFNGEYLFSHGSELIQFSFSKRKKEIFLLVTNSFSFSFSFYYNFPKCRNKKEWKYIN